MSRLPDWQTRLERFLAERRKMPFEWGKNDCCLMACDGVLAITGGPDPAEGLRAHRTAQEALAVLEAGGGVAALAERRLGPEILPALAAAGDVGMVDTEGRAALVICAGDHWCGPGAAGLEVYPYAAALRAWRCC